MPPKVPQQSVFNLGTLVNVGAILLGIMITGTGTFLSFYYTTKQGLEQIPLQLAAESAARQKSFESESEARERLRAALQSSADEMRKSVEALSAHSQVQDERIQSLNIQLDRVVTSIGKVEDAITGRDSHVR